MQQLIFRVPPQHGAWAFLALPLALGLVATEVSWRTLLFAAVWVLAYPASYFLGRAIGVRIRRGQWSRLARRELGSAAPWLIPAAVGALVLAVSRPVLLLALPLLLTLWLVSIRLTLHGRERGFTNDVILVIQSLLALPLMAMCAGLGFDSRLAFVAGVTGLYLMGTVVHVKALIREADDARWHRADIAYHALALAAVLVTAWLSWPFPGQWWLAVPFALAMARSLAMRPGARPGLIGAVEVVLSVLVFLAAALSLP